MTTSLPRGLATAAVAVVLLSGPASAQESGGFLDGLFGRPGPAQDRVAQLSGSELVVRLERMENQVRQLTGVIEQLQFRNQQLEQALRRMQEDTEYRFQELGSRGGSGGAMQPGPAPQMRQPAPPAPARRGDAFDPRTNPNAPGAPRMLGGGSAALPPSDDGPDVIVADETPVGVPGGRSAGAPLDLSTLAGNAARDPALAPDASQSPVGTLPPPPRGPSMAAPPQVAAVAPPSQTPKDEFDLGYGYLLRKDYALAEETLRGFLKKYPRDRLASDAEYWLGESLFQRQRYREAAESFLRVSTKYNAPAKAPDSLLRLAQSLAALGEKETACGALGEIVAKYPRASASVKQSVEREQKRVRC